MQKQTKYWLLGGGLVLATGLGVWGIPKLLKAVKQVNIYLQSVQNLKFSNMALSFDAHILFVNPSDITLKIELGTVRAFIQGAELGYAQPESQRVFVIPKRSQKQLRNIKFTIPASSLGMSIISLFNDPNTLNNIQIQIIGKVNGHSFDETISLNNNPQIQQTPQPKALPQNTNYGNATYMGVGVTASTHRNIKDGSELNKYFPKPDKNDIIVMQNGNVEDTVKLMIDIVKKYHKDTEQIAKALVKDNLHNTLYNIWNFVYAYIQYKPDAEGVEQLRRPARTWADRKSGADCDCMSIFIGSILYNLKIPFKFRITKYDHKPNFQHVYVIVPTGKGKYITVDTVLDQFNGEKEFTEHKDFKMM